jgi:hypothetical protein
MILASNSDEQRARTGCRSVRTRSSSAPSTIYPRAPTRSSRRTISTVFPDRIALYLDEGSRYITVRNNLVDGAGTWLTVNTQNDYAPLRASIDNTARGNWYTQSKLTGRWVAHNNNRLDSNELVEPGAWLAAAKKVMEDFTPARAQCHESRSPQTAHGAGR